MAVITRKGLKLAAKNLVFLPVRAVLFGLAFVVRTVWAAAYIASGQYALDKRLNEWIK